MDIKKLYEKYKETNKEKIKKRMITGDQYTLQSDIERVFITQIKVDIKNEILEEFINYINKFPDSTIIQKNIKDLDKQVFNLRKKIIKDEKNMGLGSISKNFPHLKKYIKEMYGREFYYHESKKPKQIE